MTSALAHIFVVDDSPDNIFLIESILDDVNYTITGFNGGEEMLSHLTDTPPDLIILDVMMPGMSGYEVTERVRANRTLPYIPILLITAHDQASLVQGLDAGADDFIRKPADVNEIRARVRALLRLKKNISFNAERKIIPHRDAYVSRLPEDLHEDNRSSVSRQEIVPPSDESTFFKVGLNRKLHRAQCFTEPAIQLDLMLIPGGNFTMGSPPEELGRYDDEGPQREVTVPTFLMGRYPITQAQWRAVATRTDLKVNIDLDPDPAEFKGDNRPVEQVTWYAAMEFCDRLSGLTGHTYCLPTEAEWEYACRAGTATPFHFGKTITTNLANYRGEDDENDPAQYPGHYGNGPKGLYRKETTTVNHFHPLANAFGLCDLHGNLWEWCLDHWHDSYDNTFTDGSAWLTDNKDAPRMLRGGSWVNLPRDCRSACRSNYSPGIRNYYVGFRVICEALGL